MVRECNGLVALNKPCGVLSHPNHLRDYNQSLINSKYNLVDESYEYQGKRVWLINRLDKETSGIILIALRKDVSIAVKKAFMRREVSKVYSALVFGKAVLNEQVWVDRTKAFGSSQAVTQVSSRGIS